MALNGVSLVTRTSFLRSLRVTSAARSISDRDAPTLIADKVPIEHGQITIPALSAEPDAGGAPRSSLAYVFTYVSHPGPPTDSRRSSSDLIVVSVSSKRSP